MNKIGVTGTRSGLTYSQEGVLRTFLKGNLVTEFHHGDCVGADVQAAAIAKSLNYKIICHPPIITELRGYFVSDEYRPPLTYFQRNRNIVDETDFLIVLPYQDSPQKSGGTWYTYDYARKKNKPLLVIYPDGRSERLIKDIDEKYDLDELL